MLCTRSAQVKGQKSVQWVRRHDDETESRLKSVEWVQVEKLVKKQHGGLFEDGCVASAYTSVSTSRLM